MWRVGELWERGEITVADEHVATEISTRVLALQREARRVAAARGDRRVMLATPAGEQHVMALRMVANLLLGPATASSCSAPTSLRSLSAPPPAATRPRSSA